MEKDDDFFGVHHISSTAIPPHMNMPGPSKRAPKETATDFLDSTFFPELALKEQSIDAPETDEGNFFDQQFFQKKDVAELKNNEELLAHMTRRQEFVEIPQKRSTKEGGRNRVKIEIEGERTPSGLDEIRSTFTPIWRFSEEQLVDMICDRVVFKDANMLAIDKPFGMAYSGGAEGRPQLDRLLQLIKARLLPKCERLFIVKSIDRHISGITLFATSSLLQQELRERMSNGEITNKYECIVRGKVPKDITIDIPLIKRTYGGDIRMLECGGKHKGGVRVSSRVSRLASNEASSYVQVTTTKEVVHQVRAHLAYSHLPIFGDSKYGSTQKDKPMGYPSQVLNHLNVTPNQAKKLPLFCHFKQMVIPPIVASRPTVSIQSPLPPHFVHVLRRMSLLKR